jgi:hypothetical protein
LFLRFVEETFTNTKKNLVENGHLLPILVVVSRGAAADPLNALVSSEFEQPTDENSRLVSVDTEPLVVNDVEL